MTWTSAGEIGGPSAGLSRAEDLARILEAFNETTENLRHSHERLEAEVRNLQAELEAANRKLAQKERLAALGEMAARVAHEVRNPLGGIQLYASLLEREGAGSRFRDLASKIIAGVRALDRTVGDLLTFTSDRAPALAEVDLAAVIEEALALARPRLEAAGVEVRRSGGEGTFLVLADRSMMTRVVLNLLLNAIDACAMEPRPRIDVAVARSTGWTRIEIHDNGPGIATDILPRIFDPFFTSKERGTGLGLAIAHRVVEDHGGWIEVETEPGCGALFRVMLAADA